MWRSVPSFFICRFIDIYLCLIRLDLRPDTEHQFVMAQIWCTFKRYSKSTLQNKSWCFVKIFFHFCEVSLDFVPIEVAKMFEYFLYLVIWESRSFYMSCWAKSTFLINYFNDILSSSEKYFLGSQCSKAKTIYLK